LSPRGCPILFLPGVLGTSLVEAARPHRAVWGSARGLVDFTRRALGPDGSSGLVPGAVLWRFEVVPGLFGLPVYKRLAGRLRNAGYELGRLDAPHRARALYPLAYDWRQDVVAGARAVEAAVQRLKAALGVPRVHLLAHSWGGNIVRYYLRYGGADVLADEPEAARPGAADVATVFGLGPLVGGTLRAVHEAQHGFDVAPRLGVGAHQASTAPCLYQIVPHGRQAAVGTDGREIDVDLSDIDTWRTRRWGVFRPDVRPRVRCVEALEERVRTWLGRGRRLAVVLESPHPCDAAMRTVTYAVRDRPTLTRLVVDPVGEPLACAEEVARRQPRLLPEVTQPGDGYVSFEQVCRFSRAPVVEDARDAPASSYVLGVGGGSHRDLYKNERVLQNLLLNLSGPDAALVPAAATA
jgi:hypothetical protein